MLSKLAKTLLLSTVSMRLALPIKLIFNTKIFPWLPTTTTIKRFTMQTIVLNSGKMRQKISNSFNNFYGNDWK